MDSPTPFIAFRFLQDALIEGFNGSISLANYVRNGLLNPSSYNLNNLNVQNILHGGVPPIGAVRCAEAIRSKFEPAFHISFKQFGNLVKATIFVITYYLRFILSYTPESTSRRRSKERTAQKLRSDIIQKMREAEEKLRITRVQIRKSREKLLEKVCVDSGRIKGVYKEGVI